MAFINWNDSFSVKVAQIDEQHQQLIKMINALNDAMMEGKGKDVLGDIVNGLISYTGTHFKTEEQYFQKFNYSEADEHVQEHKAFVEKVSEFKDGFDKGNLTLSIEVLNFLSGWLKSHIKGSDQKYSQCFNENGLQ